MQDSIAISLIISIVGCFVGLAGWLAGRDRKISSDSEWRGSVDTKLDSVLKTMKSIDDVAAQLREDISHLKTQTARNEQSIKQAHKRIDELHSELSR